MSTFEHPDFDHHELVAFKEDQTSGLKAIIAVHNSNLGPALGGCRMFDYVSSDAALKDVLRLSRGMTYKSALAGIAIGGGKSVIIGNPQKLKTRELMLAMGSFIDSLGGKYIGAEDSGTGVSDIKIMAQNTQYVSGIIEGEEHGGDPSPITAYGVYQGILACAKYKYQTDLKGLRIAIQGVGNVGFHLAKLLTQAGAVVYGADINPINIDRAVSELGIIKTPLENILSLDVDILAPCALGGAINDQSIHTIKAGVIAGAANNQMNTINMGEAMLTKGILYAPDYVINAGGIIDVYYQTQGIRDTAKVNTHVESIAVTLSKIFDVSNKLNKPTGIVADEMAEEIFKHSSLQNHQVA